jgi:hypothetical protein
MLSGNFACFLKTNFRFGIAEKPRQKSIFEKKVVFDGA